MKTPVWKSAALAALLLVPALADGADQPPLKVTVSILPQSFFAREIGGEQVEVQVLVGPGHSPATFEPTPRQLAGLQDSDLFIAAAVPFERGLVPRVEGLPNGPKLVGPRLKAGQDHHDHGHDGHHHHGIDPHTWLDPMQAADMARNMAQAFGEMRPEYQRVFQRRLADLVAKLEALDQEIRRLLAPHRGKRIFVFHPAFGHFAAAYGLEQVAVEDQGHEPGPRQLAKVVEQARAAGAVAIIVQPQFSQKAAATVARNAGLQVVGLDPLSDDYLNNMRHIARTISRTFVTSMEESP